MLLKENKQSNTSQNIQFLLEKYDCQDLPELILNQNLVKHTRVYELQQDEDWKPKIIEELCLMKLGLLESPIDEHEIDFLLEEISAG